MSLKDLPKILINGMHLLNWTCVLFRSDNVKSRTSQIHLLPRSLNYQETS